jgi:putative MATE family efflux protein
MPEDHTATDVAPAFQRKGLFRLTYPIFLYTFLALGSVFVSQMLVSRYSENLAASINLANQVLGAAYDLSGLMAVGGLVMISQCLGRDDLEQAQWLARLTIWSNTLVSAAIALVLFIGGPFFLKWVNTPPEIYPDTLTYLYIIGFAMIANGFLVAATAVLRCYGHTLEILLIGVACSIVYLLLEYTLIFGHFGAPELGVTGSGLATLLGRGLHMALLLAIIIYRVKISLWASDLWTGAWGHLRKMATISLPSVGENLAYNLYQIRMMALIAALGTGSILTRSYVLTITAFLSMITLVVSDGNEILIGYDKGGVDHAAARRRGLRTAWGTALASGLMALGLWAFSDQLLGVFTKDPAVLAGGKTLLLITALYQPFQAISVVLFCALRAAGDVFVPVVAGLLITWCLALPLGWWAIRAGWGVSGIWWAMAVSETARAAFMYWRWLSGRWMRYRVTEAAS